MGRWRRHGGTGSGSGKGAGGTEGHLAERGIIAGPNHFFGIVHTLVLDHHFRHNLGLWLLQVGQWVGSKAAVPELP